MANFKNYYYIKAGVPLKQYNTSFSMSYSFPKGEFNYDVIMSAFLKKTKELYEIARMGIIEDNLIFLDISLLHSEEE